LVVNHARFINNRANTGSILYAFDNFNDIPTMNASLLFYNTEFRSNYALTGAFDLSDASLYIINCTVSDNTNNLINLVTSYLKVVNLKIINLKCFSLFPGCIARATSKSSVNIEGLIASEVDNIVEGGGIFLEESSLVFKGSVLNNVLAISLGGSCLISKSSVVTLLSNNFSSYNGNCLDLFQSNVTIESSRFVNTEFNKIFALQKDGILYSEACILSESNPLISIKNSIFENNVHSNLGGAIRYRKNTNIDQIQVVTSIENSNFSNNFATSGGGALYVEDVQLFIGNSIFQSNKASIGGAIFFYNEGIFINI
jgi:predicted outer membrane repeat protein